MQRTPFFRQRCKTIAAALLKRPQVQLTARQRERFIERTGFGARGSLVCVAAAATREFRQEQIVSAPHVGSIQH